MSVGEVTIAAPRRVRVRGKAIARSALLAALWGGFFCWCLLVMRGQALVEASKAVNWLATVLAGYLGLTALWIAYNAMLYLVRGPAQVEAAEEPTFEKDYFGRPIALADGSSFSDQHLVLEFKEGKKVYRAVRVDENEIAAQSDADAGQDLRRLAAAAGQSVAPAPEPSPEPAPDASKRTPHAHGIRGD